MKILIHMLTLILLNLSLQGQNADGYEVGDVATDFKLKNIDGQMVALSDYESAKGFIVIFTCNHCPYAKAYEQRILALDKKYADQGYPVIAINPNDPSKYPADSYENMQKRAQEKGYTFPYLFDATQEVAATYGAERTPHVYLLNKTGQGLKVAYIGAIDDNVQHPGKVEKKYVEAAIQALEAGKKPETQFTKAIGCTIKWK